MPSNNHLARLGHAYEDSGKFMSVAELADGFELPCLGKTLARHDAKQLMHWQREASVNLIRRNINFPEEVRHWLDVLYTESLDYPEDAHDGFKQVGHTYFDAALNVLEATPDNYKDFIEQLKAESGCRGKELFMPLRMALSGRSSGPELAPLYELMSEARKNERLSNAKKLAD